MRTNTIKILCIGWLIFGSILRLTSQEQVNVYESIDRRAQSFLKHKEINSVSIGVYKDGEIYTRHLGTLIKGEEIAPNDSSLYEIASVTKTMTGYLVAKAVLDNKLTLEDDVRVYLGDEFSNLEYNGVPVTLQHLLTHTSGLPLFLPQSMNGVFEKLNKTVPTEYYELEKAFTRTDFLDALKEVTLDKTPGAAYSYSNAGAEIVGYILEQVYRKDIETLYKEQLTGLYNMTHTSITVDANNEKDRVQGYWMKNDSLSPNQLNSFWGTGSAMTSSLSDIMKYIELQLATDNPIVSKSYEVLHKEGNTLKVGYFWRIWQDKYGTSYNHHGGTSGMQNWIYIYPKYNLGISIFTNQSGPKTPQRLSKVVRNLLKDLIKA